MARTDANMAALYQIIQAQPMCSQKRAIALACILQEGGVMPSTLEFTCKHGVPDLGKYESTLDYLHLMGYVTHIPNQLGGRLGGRLRAVSPPEPHWKDAIPECRERIMLHLDHLAPRQDQSLTVMSALMLAPRTRPQETPETVVGRMMPALSPDTIGKHREQLRAAGLLP